ncbi:MAG: peptidoglycan binding domain-containing protein [Filifactoraceae bacterium]
MDNLIRKWISKKILIESLVVTIGYISIVSVFLILVYFLVGNNVEVFIDNDKLKFSSFKEITAYIDENLPQDLTIYNSTDKTKHLQIPLSSLEASYLDNYTIELINKKFNESLLKRMKLFFFKKQGSNNISISRNIIYYDSEKIWEFVRREIEALNYQPVDAFIFEEGDKIVIRSEKNGVDIDAYQLFEIIKSALKKADFTDLMVKAYPVSAKIKTNDLKRYKLKKSSVSMEVSDVEFDNNISKILLNKLNNTMIPGQTAVEIKKDFYAYLDDMTNEKIFSESEKDKIFKEADKIFVLLKMAFVEAGFPIREDKEKTELRTYIPQKKDAIVSSYLDGNKIKILIVMVE